MSALPPDATLLYGIGAQKAGTSWLFDMLAAHPQVHVSPAKELHYFDTLAGRNRQTLRARLGEIARLTAALAAQDLAPDPAMLTRLAHVARLTAIHAGGPENGHAPYLDYLCAGWAGQRVITDITPSYAVLSREHFAEMASCGPAKFLFVLRDPVARMWSQIRMTLRGQMPAGTTPGELARAAGTHAESLIASGRLAQVERANYARTLRELDASVAPDDLLVVFYETLFEPETLARLSRFLGIAPLSADPGRQINPGLSAPIPADIETQFRAIFAPQYAAIRARFGPDVPASWGQPLIRAA